MSWQGRGAGPTGSVLLHGEDRIGVSDAVQGATYGAAAGFCEKCGLAREREQGNTPVVLAQRLCPEVSASRDDELRGGERRMTKKSDRRGKTRADRAPARESEDRGARLTVALARISHSHLLRHRRSRPGLRQSHRSDPHCAGSTAPVGSAALPCQDTTYGTSRRCL